VIDRGSDHGRSRSRAGSLEKPSPAPAPSRHTRAIQLLSQAVFEPLDESRVGQIRPGSERRKLSSSLQRL
jgi:hypothetical protein